MLEQLSGLGIRASAVRELPGAGGPETPNGLANRQGPHEYMLGDRALWLASHHSFFPAAQRLGFRSSELAWALTCLGAVLLLDDVSGGRIALLQGMRRIEDLRG